MGLFQARRFFLSLAILAVLARAVLPAGFMPDLANKSFHLVICTGEGAQNIAASDTYNPFAPLHSSQQHKSCDFSLNAAIVLAALIFIPFAVLMMLHLARIHWLAIFIPRRRYRFAVAQAPPLSI